MADRNTSRRLAAVVAADVAGFSRLMDSDEEGTLSALQMHRRELTDPKIEEYGGRIVKVTGDGLLLEFSSVVDAVQCCLDVQLGMLERNNETPLERRIQFRVGINLGDIIIDDDDIFGNGVNIAARLEAMSDPGGICISQAVLDQIKGKLALNIEDLGDRALKNIEEPVHAYRIVHNVQTEFDAAATNKAEGSLDTHPPLPKRSSIAIMPFRNANGDPKVDYIADGIGLGIQSLLVQLSGLFLVNANAHQSYRDGKTTAAEAVKELPIQYVLEGAVQQADRHVRVTVQLTDLHDNVVVWADTYDRDLESVFALQDEVAVQVASSIGSGIFGFDRVWTRGLTGGGAWEHFLRGMSHFYKFTKLDNAIARVRFEKIFELRPSKVIGPSYVAVTHWFDATRGWVDEPSTSMMQARDWAEKCIDSDEENNGLGHVVLGSIRLREGRHDEGLALCRKGVAFRANCPWSLGQLADAQIYCGDAQSAVKTARESLAVRMIYPPPLINVLAVAYRDSGNVPLSISTAREAARLDPQHADALVTLCSAYMLADLEGEAHRVAGEIIELDPRFRISSYANNLHYKDVARIRSIVETLRSAGLPE